MKRAFILGAVLALAPSLHGQSKWETAANFAATAADVGQTCYNLAATPGWHEKVTPSQNCATIAGLNFLRAGAAWGLDHYLERHGHPRLAHFQAVSASMAAGGIVLTYTVWKR